MPLTEVLAFKSGDKIRIWEWLADLESREPKVFAKGYARLERLAELGSELRRPESDLLHGGIRELRIGFRSMNYRILFFFHGKDIACVIHGIIKEDEVPEEEIQYSIEAKKFVLRDPDKY